MAARKARSKQAQRQSVSEGMAASHRAICDVILQIPRGKVMTYGQVAEAAGLRGAARLVGYTLRAVGRRVPWQRVLGQRRKGVAQVAIKDPVGGTEQRLRLEGEGVHFSPSGGVDLARFGFRPRPKLRSQAMR